ncbi:hypothetical protein [uncultured Shewanella sp.]|uniref:c-type cytochrome n=1 Tax=uncultured Shewanella sp. TaxID=173975 RepID=UPI00262A9169|nr:hypothetical protein [uncultured Shewanella sp.]
MRLELSLFTGSENMHFQVVWVYSLTYAASSDTLALITQTREQAHYSCAGCHTIDGNPPITDKYNKQSPRLAGKDVNYVMRQLLAFQAGERHTDEMKGIMQDYSHSEINHQKTLTKRHQRTCRLYPGYEPLF